MNNRISIITVSYNSEKSIWDTVESLLIQKLPNFECIFVDGASTDRTQEIILKGAQLLRSRGISVKVISEPDKGIYDAMNKGVIAATGDIIGFLNSDDQLKDDSVLSEISEYFVDPALDCVHGNVVFVDSNQTDKIVRRWQASEYSKGLFNKSWTPAHPTFYCKKAAYLKHGLYRNDLKIAADVELMFRFLELNSIKSRYINKVLVKMRNGGISNRGLSSIITITAETREFISFHDKDFSTVKYLFYKFLKIRQLCRR